MSFSLMARLEKLEERPDPKRGPCVVILLPLAPSRNAERLAALVRAEAEGRRCIRIDLRPAEERRP